jgi:3-oxoacyl-[acyl-carrier-protein] synthase II/nodulation protein E
VITGAGCVTAIGNSVTEFSEALFAGRSGISPLELSAGHKLNFSTAAQIKNFAAETSLPPSMVALTERSAQFALVSARQAVEESHLLDAYSPAAIAVVMGCAVGGREAEEPELVKLYSKQGRVHPFTIPRVMASSGASQISILFGITGPVLNFSTACASSAHAIGHAFHMVRSGMVEAAIAGGHEAPLTYGFLKAWEAMRVVSPTSCKPFSSLRDGMTLGEGAAALVLEEREHALSRGATVYAEISGFGMSSDASHITHPSPAGPATAMRQAIADAQLQPSSVNYINAHGTGTDVNDRVEAEAIHEVFGPSSSALPVSSTKALHGHAIGAAGAIEALATILALRHRLLPASIGADSPDDSLRLNLVQSVTDFAPDAALSNSFAFGGLNAALLFRSAFPG